MRDDPATGSEQQTGAATNDHVALLSRTIQVALQDYLHGRRLAQVKVRQIEGDKIEGFLKIEGNKGESLLVDFRVTSTPKGRLSSLEVDGQKVAVHAGAMTKRTR